MNHFRASLTVAYILHIQISFNSLKEVQIETYYVKCRITEKLQNLKFKNKEKYIKTDMDKYTNNEINKLL